jgi:hypothetical protein
VFSQWAKHDCQQALAELLWGETPFSTDPVTEITHSEGLNLIAEDARLCRWLEN